MQYVILIAVIIGIVWLITRSAKARRSNGKSREEQLVEYGGLTFMAPKPISNEEYQRKRQAEMDVWEKKYDLSSVQGIEAIPVPKRKEPSGGGIQSVTGRLEYYLMLKAGQYETAGEVDLALACYRKANALMPVSPVPYDRDRYMRLPRYLRKLRRFDEARVEEAKIEELFGEGNRFVGESKWAEERNKRLFSDLKQLKTDLVEASYIRCCCAECAKYRERVYSVSGKDSRFPKLPEYLLAGEHDCGIMLYPFLDGVNSMRTRDGKDLNGAKIIKYSNRPFVDDRPPDELRDIEGIERQRATDSVREQNRKDYDWLWEHLPSVCPKSLSGYSRMKNANSENYQKIVAEAAKLGYKIK